MAGSTLATIIGTRVYIGIAMMAGAFSFLIIGQRVLCGVAQMGGSTALIIIVTVDGVYLTCYTVPVRPTLHRRRPAGSIRHLARRRAVQQERKNYVF